LRIAAAALPSLACDDCGLGVAPCLLGHRCFETGDELFQASDVHRCGLAAGIPDRILISARGDLIFTLFDTREFSLRSR